MNIYEQGFINELGVWVEKYPLLKGIGAVHLAIYKAIGSYELPATELPDLDSASELFTEGVPLLQSNLSTLIDKKLAGKILLQAIEGVKDSDLAKKQINALANVVNSTKIAEELFEVVLNSDDASDDSSADNFFNGNELDRSFALYIAWAVIAYMLSPHLAKLEEWQAQKSWKYEYCPTCGNQAVMSHLKRGARGRSRYLRCGCCQTDWMYKRLGCPYCNTEDQQYLSILEVENEKNLRLDVCDACDSYVKTYISESASEVALQDWASLHLDIVALDTKYKKKGNILVIELE